MAISSTGPNATEKPTGIGIDYDDNDEITVSYWFQFPENFNRDNGDYVMNSDYSVASNRYSFYFKDENGDDTIYFLNDPEINNHLQFKWANTAGYDTTKHSWPFSVGNLKNKWVHIVISIYKTKDGTTLLELIVVSL